MLKHNLGYIGLGTIHDNVYQNRLKNMEQHLTNLNNFNKKQKKAI